MDRISAFMDGESSLRETHQALLNLKQKSEFCEVWGMFHLIGDIMRGDPALRDDFAARLRERMEREPILLAPRLVWHRTANIALSAAASVAAVAIVLALVLTDNPLRPQAPVAAIPQPAATQVSQTAALPQRVAAANQTRFNEYLMAHQEFSPSTALQGVALYVRSVSATRDDSGR